MKDLLLITPPFTQLNTPYPATPYLKGFLNTKGISSYQMDLGIEVILELFSSEGLRNIFETIVENDDMESENSGRILALREEYIRSIDPVILFLQGKNPTLGKTNKIKKIHERIKLSSIISSHQTVFLITLLH